MHRVVSPLSPSSSHILIFSNTFPDVTRRSSDGSIASAPTPPPQFTPTIPAFNRAELFQSLRPMASTESLNFTMNSKRTFSFSMWALSCRNPTAFSPFVLARLAAPHSAFRALHFSISCCVLLTLRVDSMQKFIRKANWYQQLVRRALAARPSAAAPAARQRITATAAARRRIGRRTVMSASPRSRRTARLRRPTFQTRRVRLMKPQKLEHLAAQSPWVAKEDCRIQPARCQLGPWWMKTADANGCCER